MITTNRIMKNINEINDNTLVEFNDFGSFLLEFFMFSIEEQKFVAEALLIASLASTSKDEITIYSIRKLPIANDSEFSFKFLVRTTFKCNFCGLIVNEEINLYNSTFRDICEECLIKL